MSFLEGSREAQEVLEERIGEGGEGRTVDAMVGEEGNHGRVKGGEDGSVWRQSARWEGEDGTEGELTLKGDIGGGDGAANGEGSKRRTGGGRGRTTRSSRRRRRRRGWRAKRKKRRRKRGKRGGTA